MILYGNFHPFLDQEYTLVEPGPGNDDVNVYDVVDERVGTTVEMKENEVYGVAKSS